MRSWICPVMLVLLMTCLTVGAMAQTEIWVQRVEDQGRLLVPIRGIFEALGATVKWDPEMRTGLVRIDYRIDCIVMYLGDHDAYISGVHYPLDVAPQMVNRRVYVPLRFVGEAMGGQVHYDGDLVHIATPDGKRVILHLSDDVAPPPGGENEYLAPWTATHLVTDADLRGKTNWRLTLIREEIYARHGAGFESLHIHNYFANQDWYWPKLEYSESSLSQLELVNAAAILDYQTRTFGAPATKP